MSCCRVLLAAVEEARQRERVFSVGPAARSNPSVCKHGAESWRTEEVWAAVLVLLCLCSSAQRKEEEGGRKREAGGR